MGLFNFLNRKKKTSTEIAEKSVIENDEKSKGKIASGIAINNSTKKTLNAAKIKYSKPEYNPQTRKMFYDDSTVHKKVMDEAFSNGKISRDPYSGAELVKKQRDAKIKYGEEWQKHAAEADHIDPLHEFVNRNKKNPFLTTDDLKKIGNSEDNFQVLSRKNNQGSKKIGKGKSTQSEWADDPVRMEGLSEDIENGKAIGSIKEKIKKVGKNAEKRNNKRAMKYALKNASTTFHEAGTYGAKNAGITTLTMSGIMNIVSVIKGEKDSEEALEETIKEGGEAAITGYLMGGGMTVVGQSLSYSSSKFVQALAENNVPGKIITAVMITGDTLKKWGEGEITTQECILQLGDKGLNMATMGYSMAVGQAIIPIPIVGGAVGALVGSMLTSELYNELINELNVKQLEHEERMKIISECNEIIVQAEKYKTELRNYLDAYFEDYKNCFDDAMSTMHVAYQMGDVEGVVASANEITRKLGGNVPFETVDEFASFLDDDSIDIL